MMKMINWFSGLDLPFALVPCLATIHLQFLFHPGRGRCLTRRSQVPPTSHASHSCVCRAFVTVANKVSPPSPLLQLSSPLLTLNLFRILRNSHFITLQLTQSIFSYINLMFPSISFYATKCKNNSFLRILAVSFAPQMVISIANSRGNILIFPRTDEEWVWHNYKL